MVCACSDAEVVNVDCKFEFLAKRHEDPSSRKHRRLFRVLICIE